MEEICISGLKLQICSYIFVISLSKISTWDFGVRFGYVTPFGIM
jgi:hypothetical protein